MAEKQDATAARSKQESREKRPAPEAPVAAALTDGPALPVFRLQRAAGNRSVARLLDRGDTHSPGPVVRRAVPQASLPPPNQSTMPPRIDNWNISLTYQGDAVIPDVEQCKRVLRKRLPEAGFEGASNYGHSFVNAGSETRIQWLLAADDAFIDRTQAAMRTAVQQFDEECRIFLERFEMTAGNLTDAMLINAETQIKAEQEKLAMQSKLNASQAGVYTSYSAGNKDYLGQVKAAAGVLAGRREVADELGIKARKAREAVEEAARPKSSGPGEPAAPLVPSNEPLTTYTSQTGGLPAFVPTALVDAQESTYRTWQDAEDEFRRHANEATAQHASLGPLLAAGTGTAARLRSFSTETAEASAQGLGNDFAEKLANIQAVRAELGGRFSIWKQPTVISMTHQRMNSGPGEQRMVRDKAAQVEADGKATKEMYAAIALGLGLLAAIPTGGSSLLAGAALAASVTGAALSAYQAYEEGQDYLLQKATANTSLDRAYKISESEPSFLFLAIDIATAVADLGAAKAAFTTLRETIAAARAAKAAEEVPRVVAAMRRAGISPQNQGRVIEEILPAGGDIGKALHEIRQAFIRTADVAVDRETALLMRDVAERALDKAKVVVVPRSRQEAMEYIRVQLSNRGWKGDALAEETASMYGHFFDAGNEATTGLYDPITKLIYIRGDATAEGAASVLVHELTHLGQDTQRMMKSMGVYKSEFEAFKAQQQFINMLPADRVPNDWLWLLRASDSDIENHVITMYVREGAVKPKGFDNASMADGIFNTLFMAGGGIK